MQHNIAEWMRKRAWISGRRLALSDPFSEYNYDVLNQRIGQLAETLGERGVRPGDRVAGLLLNGTQFFEILFATVRLGAIFVPLNYRLSASELSFILYDAGARVFFYHDEFTDTVAALRNDAPLESVVSIGSGMRAEGREAYEELIIGQSGAAPVEPVSADDVAMIMYTSGTTGHPKGAMLTHGNTVWNAIQTIGRMPIQQEDRLLVVAPMFHIGGLGVFAFPGLYIGASVFIRPSFDPADALRTIQEKKITTKFGVPAMWQAIMAELKQGDYDIQHLKLAVTGGAPCPLPVLRFFQLRGVAFVEGFGLTETSPTCAILDHIDAERKNGSVGFPAMFVDLKIADDRGQKLAAGEAGELLIRGPNVFKGYWNRPEATAEALRGGWFYTGDIGYLDDEGFLFIIDRKKDMLISGGENVYPAEVEKVIYEHPDVVDVAVIGVPDSKWQEVPRAIVVRREGSELEEAGVIEFCREVLAKFKVPKSAVFVEELPRSASGKILKRELRDRLGSADI